MNNPFSRRKFLQTSAMAGAAVVIPSAAFAADAEQKPDNTVVINKNPLKIGLMTYLLGSKWDIETIIKNCTETGFQSVELRTTHAHGVEVKLTSAERDTVKKRFKDSALETISLASAFQYHSPDPAELKKNIEGTKEYILLAKDVGATGIRVFPNAFPEGVDREKTMQQIGKSLAEVGKYGHDNGIEIRVCVHGSGTNSVQVIKKIIDYSQSPYVYVNWNCDLSDAGGEGLLYNFNSVKERIRGVHMHDLHDPAYPHRQLFRLLADNGFKGYCNAEVGRVSCEPVEFMKCYKGLFLALQNAI